MTSSVRVFRIACLKDRLAGCLVDRFSGDTWFYGQECCLDRGSDGVEPVLNYSRSCLLTRLEKIHYPLNIGAVFVLLYAEINVEDVPG
jgi:hypothetical protein